MCLLAENKTTYSTQQQHWPPLRLLLLVVRSSLATQTPPRLLLLSLAGRRNNWRQNFRLAFTKRRLRESSSSSSASGWRGGRRRRCRCFRRMAASNTLRPLPALSHFLVVARQLGQLSPPLHWLTQPIIAHISRWSLSRTHWSHLQMTSRRRRRRHHNHQHQHQHHCSRLPNRLADAQSSGPAIGSVGLVDESALIAGSIRDSTNQEDAALIGRPESSAASQLTAVAAAGREYKSHSLTTDAAADRCACTPMHSLPP